MSITLRAYNVLFGDCLLISWDEDQAPRKRHAWVDFGNFHNDKNDVFHTVYEDVKRRTDGHLALMVITHRHLDHLEGFYTMRNRFAQDFTIDKLWHPHVTKGLDDVFKISEAMLAAGMPETTRFGAGTVGRIYRNNFGTKGITTKKRMEDILATLPCLKKNQHTVHRLSKRKTIMPEGLERLRIEVLAPERNSRAYLKPLEHAVGARQAMADGLEAGRRRGARDGGRRDDPFELGGGVPAEKSELIQLADFARLRRQLRTGGLDLLAAVDKTRNNTSIVLSLEYDGKKMLLPGDAEEKSWEIMEDKVGAALESDLIKVAHHGSVNASPEGIFDKVLTRRRKTNAVVLSTDESRYPSDRYTNEVPKDEVVAGWKARLSKTNRRTRLKRTDKKALGKSVRVRY